jgi:hypothetical protein
MITLFKKVPRDEILETISKKFSDHELVRFNGFSGDVTEITIEIESQSLFGGSRIVFLSDIDREIWSDVIKALHHVPETTEVFWLEDSFPVALTKGIPEHKVVESKEKKVVEKSNPFQIANQLAFAKPGQLWATYQQLLNDGHEPEAVFGIIWWKLKDVARKKTIITSTFKQTLNNFLSMYSRARSGGTDMETGLEELLLQLSPKDLQ